ncbi:MAG: Fe(2+)-trafficking protein [Myxococcota bacterium]
MAKIGLMNQKLSAPPFGGPLGQEIFEKISQEEWDGWRDMQTKIINEYRLDLSEPADRQKLMKQMRLFLKLDQSSEAVLEVGTPA